MREALMASCWPIFFFLRFLILWIESKVKSTKTRKKKKTTNFKITLIIVMITERESHIHPS